MSQTDHFLGKHIILAWQPLFIIDFYVGSQGESPPGCIWVGILTSTSEFENFKKQAVISMMQSG